MASEAKWAQRRKKRSRKVKFFEAEHAKARREARKQRRRYKAHREALVKLRKQRDPDPAEIAEHKRKRDEARKEYLAAQRDVDEATDALRHWRAMLARAIKKLRSFRKAGKVYSRAEWGARPPRGSYTRNSAITKQVLHHTVTSPPGPNATVAEDAAHMRYLQNLHLSQGWTDLGYTRVVMPSGRIFEGRPAWAVGAHVMNNNTGTLGVSCAGNYEADQPSRALVAGAKKAAAGLPGSGAPMVGHHQLNQTACPGQHLKPKINEIGRGR